MIPKTKVVDGPGAVVGSKETELKLITPRVTIQPKTLELLQEQIKHELFAERLYQSIASWCDYKGMTETAKFYSLHADEEHKHALRFVNFIQKRGEHAHYPDTEQPVQEFESLREAVDASLDHEYFITDRIKNIYEMACEEKDYLAKEHARDFIAEQTEEEQLFLSLSGWLDVCGNEGNADFEMEVVNLHKRKVHIVGEL